jgi:hypothetical protein
MAVNDSFCIPQTFHSATEHPSVAGHDLGQLDRSVLGMPDIYGGSPTITLAPRFHVR